MADFAGTGPLSPEKIKAAVASALANDPDIPAGHRGALVLVANTDQVEVALATRIRDGWTVDLVAAHEWTGDNQIGIVSKMTW